LIQIGGTNQLSYRPDRVKQKGRRLVELEQAKLRESVAMAEVAGEDGSVDSRRTGTRQLASEMRLGVAVQMRLVRWSGMHHILAGGEKLRRNVGHDNGEAENGNDKIGGSVQEEEEVTQNMLVRSRSPGKD
jgi:hypothetical protein